MKITYYHNDETVVIDVDPEWGELVVSMHKAEHYDNLSRRKNCYSMDALEYEGAEYGKEDPGITSFGEDDPETMWWKERPLMPSRLKKGCPRPLCTHLTCGL